MNFQEAEIMMNQIKPQICDHPIAVYDGSENGHPYGVGRMAPAPTDPAVLACRINTQKCIFAGGDSCPLNIKPEDFTI